MGEMKNEELRMKNGGWRMVEESVFWFDAYDDSDEASICLGRFFYCHSATRCQSKIFRLDKIGIIPGAKTIIQARLD